MDVITGGSQWPFSCILDHFWQGDNRTNERPGDPRASLLLTSEKAVIWNFGQKSAKIGEKIELSAGGAK